MRTGSSGTQIPQPYLCQSYFRACFSPSLRDRCIILRARKRNLNTRQAKHFHHFQQPPSLPTTPPPSSSSSSSPPSTQPLVTKERKTTVNKKEVHGIMCSSCSGAGGSPDSSSCGINDGNERMPNTLGLAVINSTHLTYINDFRVEQCQLFLQHKCSQHRPYTCFFWHFMNQRRRRPHVYTDGLYNYNCDIYCDSYDEQTGICANGDSCPLVHRNAGDTERRYHPIYYKTAWCTFQTDKRGNCVKNGAHCALAHTPSDVRISSLSILCDAESAFERSQYILSVLERDRQANDDPKWNDTLYVLEWYKTEPCKRPARICRQGYACPQYHNPRDRRRNPFVFTYRSTPCPNVKQSDEWNEPSLCESGDLCAFCHTRTEQQFHPEIYKTTKCNDIVQHMYCPRGTFCAFAHSEVLIGDLKENRDSRSSQSSHSLINNEVSAKTQDKKQQQYRQENEFSSSTPRTPSPQYSSTSWKPAALQTPLIQAATSRQLESPRKLQAQIKLHTSDSNLLSPHQQYGQLSEKSVNLEAFSKLSLVKNDNRASVRTIAPPPGLENEAAIEHESFSPSVLTSRLKLGSQLSSSFGGLASTGSDDRYPFEHQTSLEQMISRSLENIGINTSSSNDFEDDSFPYTSRSRIKDSDCQKYGEDLQFCLTPVSLSPTPQRRQQDINNQRTSSKYGSIGERRKLFQNQVSPQDYGTSHSPEADTSIYGSDLNANHLKVPALFDSIHSRSCSSSPGTIYSTLASSSHKEGGVAKTCHSDASMIMAFAEKSMLEKEVDWLRSKVASLEGCISKQKQALEMMQDHAQKASLRSEHLERERNELTSKYTEALNELSELKRINSRDAELIWSDQKSEEVPTMQSSPNYISHHRKHFTSVSSLWNASRPNECLKPNVVELDDDVSGRGRYSGDEQLNKEQESSRSSENESISSIIELAAINDALDQTKGRTSN